MTDSRPTLTLPSRPDRPIGPPPRLGERIVEPPPRPPRPTVTAKRLKVALTLNADELASVPVEDGRPRVKLRIQLPDRKVVADIATKSLKKAQLTIRKAGADNVALVLQGCLLADDTIAEAGLNAQLKAAKP